MTAVFRRESGEPIQASDSWILREQIADVSAWLLDPANADSVRNSILDFGLNCRIGEPMVGRDSRMTTIAMQGEVVSREFLRQLVDLNIELWLSIYPGPNHV
jgi:hypothetical protein